MSEIYGSSALTISATASPDSNGGLFHKASPSQLGHRFEFSTLENPAGWEMWIRERLAHPTFLDGSESVGDTHPLPLLTRAWCFQERLLAPRVLHFSEYEIIWDCRTHLFCECKGA